MDFDFELVSVLRTKNQVPLKIRPLCHQQNMNFDPLATVHRKPQIQSNSRRLEPQLRTKVAASVRTQDTNSLPKPLQEIGATQLLMKVRAGVWIFLFLTFRTTLQVNSLSRCIPKMVEGHSVHRVAALHRQRLLGKRFTATSPNGRFTEGAKAIDGKIFSRIEAVGKNLFAFFTDEKKSKEDDAVVVHVHFGMAGAWAVFQGDEPVPEPTPTNRLRLHREGITADLSAMTCQHGGIELYQQKRAKLGEDPLRDDADPDGLWAKVRKTPKSIGKLIMDQSYFTGPGNIYRAEILFKAGIHPDRPGNTLEKEEFDTIWHHTVDLLTRGYQTGSILTVDPDEAVALGKPNMRRYIYNVGKCPRCATNIKVWDIQSRTCYACVKCQPLNGSNTYFKLEAAVVTPQTEFVPFNSHCAPESADMRLKESGPSRLTVKELKAKLAEFGETPPKSAKKANLVELLTTKMQKDNIKPTAAKSLLFVSPEDAAAEKAKAGENLAVEHIAELASGQARKARARAAQGKSNAHKAKRSKRWSAEADIK